MSRVSIIIPAYNQARFLGAAIESCLRQSHADLEVIVIDDGSTDDTPRVTSRYAGRVHCIRQDNQGLAAARNRGIEASTGDYLCFLDSDDIYLPEKIAEQAALLDEDEGLAFVYCDMVTLDEEGREVADAPCIADLDRPLSGNLFGALVAGGYFPPHTVMIRRGVLDAVGGFDPELGGHADYDLWLRVAAMGFEGSFMPGKLAGYRTYPTSMSKDGEHMRATRRAALAKVARMHPDLFGPSVEALQQSNEDLFRANQLLQARWEHAWSGSAAGGADAAQARERFDFLRNVERAAMVQGRPEQQEVWEVTLEDTTSRALLLQPPAQLVFEVPTHLRGRLRTAAAIHPEAWTKPGAGGCEFRVRIDGRLAYAVALDPIRCPGDRAWHSIQIDVPPNPAGAHKVALETRAVGAGTDFRWALWRAPEFSWAVPAAPADTRRSTQPVLHAA